MTVRQFEWTDAEGKRHKRWQVDVDYQHPDGRKTRVRKFSPVDTRRGAEEYERQVRSALLAGTWGKEHREPATLAELAQRLVADSAHGTMRRRALKPGSVDFYRTTLNNHILPKLGRLKAADITEDVVTPLLRAWKKAGVRPKSINNRLGCLRRVLSLAVERGELAMAPVIAPVEDLSTDASGTKTPRFLTFDEADRLVAYFREHLPDWHPMVLVMLRTGLRISEAIALQWEDVDFAGRRLLVRRSVWTGEDEDGERRTFETLPKSNKPRELPLSDEAVRALRAHFHERAPWVFCSRRGTQRNRHVIYKPLAAAAKAIGVDPFGPHVLRHTFASHLVMLGVPLRIVQALMGHATIEMTERYSHVAPTVLREPVGLLDAAARYATAGRPLAGAEASAAAVAAAVLPGIPDGKLTANDDDRLPRSEGETPWDTKIRT